MDGTNFTSDDERIAVNIAQQLADAITVRRYRPRAARRSSGDGVQEVVPFSVRKSDKAKATKPIKQFRINRYCTLCVQVCGQEATVYRTPSAFLAYPFEKDYPSLMKKVKAGLEAIGYDSVLPIDPGKVIPNQGVLFCKLCHRIYGTNMLLAEVTELNRNVLFEAGYALGLGKQVYFLINQDRVRPGEVAVTRDFESVHYSNCDDILSCFPQASRIVARDLSPTGSQFYRAIKKWSHGYQPRTAYCILPEDRYHQSDIKDAVYATLRKLEIAIIKRDAMAHTLYAECMAINQAEFVIGDWVGDNTEHAEEKNASAAVLLGLTMALGKKMIILQQSPVRKRMIDMAGVIADWSTHEQLVEILESKLGSEDLRRSVQPEEDVAALVKRELTTYRIHGRLMSIESFDFVYEHRQLLKLTPEEQAFLELCANCHGYPKWGFRQTEFEF